MDEKQLRVIDTTEPTNCPFIVQRVSPQISLYDSASGKILLAYLSEKERAEYLERMPMTPFQKSFEDKQKNFDVVKMDIQKNTTLFLPEYQRCQCRSLIDIIMNCLEV